jgi:WD40 repeat protein
VTRSILIALALAGSALAQPGEMATLTTPARADAFVLAKTGKIGAAVCVDKKLRVWALPEGRLAREIDLGERNIYPSAFAISDDGTWIAASDYSGLHTVWNASTSAVQTEIKLPYYSVKLAFSPDGNRLALAPSGEPVQIHDVASGRKLLELERTVGGSQAMAFSRDGGRIATADSDTVVRIYDARNGELLARYADSLMEPLAASFAADGKHVLTGGGDKVIAMLDASMGSVVWKSGKLVDPVAYLEVSPDGSFAAVGLMHADNLMMPAPLLVTETSSGRQVQEWTPPGLMLGGGWTSDGHLIAATGLEKGLQLWRVR